jgi:hypothetical protein
MASEQVGLNQDPNIRAQYQSVLQELMLFFQNNLQLNHYDILNNTDDNFLDNLYTVEESAFE